MKSLVTNLILLALLWSANGYAVAAESSIGESQPSKEEIVRLIMEADTRFSEGEYASAEALYKRVISIAPKNREGYLGLGRIEFLHGDSAQALEHFKKAVSVSPQSAPAHFELGSTLLSIGKLNEALVQLTLASELDPQRPEIQYRLSQARSLVEASRLTPQSGTVRIPERWAGLRGPGTTRPDTPAPADRGTAGGGTAVKPKPGTISPPTTIGSAPKNPQTNLKDPTALPTRLDSLNIDQTSEVSLVYRLITSGRVEETMVQGLHALKQQPDNASLRYQIGLMYKVRGDIDKAIETFEETLKYDPEHTQSLAQLTELFISRHEMEKAKEIATRWVAADPDNPNAHFSLAWAYVVERTFKEALPHMREAAQLDPRNTDLLNHLGLVLREMGDDHQAAVYFERALVLAPASAAPRLNLAMIDIYDQRNQEARDMIKPLLDNIAVTPHVRSVESLINARDGRLSDAEAEARDVLKSSPQNPIAALALAVVAREKGNLDEAATILETSYNNNPKNVLVIHGLAEVYLAQGKTDKAIEFATIAHKRSPNKFLIAKTLALALAKANNTVVALDTIKQMRELGDDPDKLFLLEATILDAANDREGALKHYQSLADKQPDNNDIAMKVAHLYFVDRKWKNADLIVDSVLSRSPNHNQARLLKAAILYELKDYKGSLRQVQLVKPDDDLDYEMTCLTARASFRLKRYSEAAQLFKSARKRQNLSTEDLIMLARALRETDETTEADEILSKVKSVKFEAKRHQT